MLLRSGAAMSSRCHLCNTRALSISRKKVLGSIKDIVQSSGWSSGIQGFPAPVPVAAAIPGIPAQLEPVPSYQNSYSEV